jgi:hypothetical protein
MKWLRQHGVSEDEIQNAKRNTGLHGSELSKLVIRVARENGDTRENSEILGEAISDSRRIKDANSQLIRKYQAEYENACDDMYYGYGKKFWYNQQIEFGSEMTQEEANEVWEAALEKMSRDDW